MKLVGQSWQLSTFGVSYFSRKTQYTQIRTINMYLLIWAIRNDAKNLKNDWNPGTWVLIWEYPARAIQWIPTWQSLNVFKKLCVLVLLTKVASALEGLRKYPQQFLSVLGRGWIFEVLGFQITPRHPTGQDVLRHYWSEWVKSRLPTSSWKWPLARPNM